MNKFTLLFGVLLCLVVVNARHYGNEETLESEDEILRRPNERNTQPRHRRRRWQTNYGYDYPPQTYHYPERREYDRNSQEVLQRISQLLEEISTYIRRPPPPPPPPQPIFIPYPMPYHIPQVPRVSCNAPDAKTDEKTPDVNKRVSDKDMDPNRNWGLVVSSESDYDDGSDGARPISFDPIVPKQIMKRPSPKVDHGSVQASHTTEPPRLSADAPLASARVPAPGLRMCNAAILSCCGMSDKTQQAQCFSNIGCSPDFDDGKACTAESIQKALESFRSSYSPLN